MLQMTRSRSYGWTAALAIVGLLACVGDGGQPLAPTQGGVNGNVALNQSPLPNSGAHDNLAPGGGWPTLAGSDTLTYFTCTDTHGPYSGSAVVGPAGGTVVFGPHSLIVPAGALPANTSITAATLHGDTLAVTFGPSGLHFNHPATLVLSYSRCQVGPAGPLSIVFANDQMTQMIALVPSQDSASKQVVEGPIYHFSVYAASESRSNSGHDH
jgi:hypothetical protein